MRVHKVVASLAVLTAAASCGFGGGTWYLGEWKCWVRNITNVSTLTIGDGTWSNVLPDGDKEVSGTWEITDGELVISNPAGIPEEEQSSSGVPEDLQVAVPLPEAPEVGAALDELLIISSESEKFEETEEITATVSDERGDITVVLSLVAPDEVGQVASDIYTCQKA